MSPLAHADGVRARIREFCGQFGQLVFPDRVRLPPSFHALHGLGNRGGADAPKIPADRADRFSGQATRQVIDAEGPFYGSKR